MRRINVCDEEISIESDGNIIAKFEGEDRLFGTIEEFDNLGMQLSGSELIEIAKWILTQAATRSSREEMRE